MKKFFEKRTLVMLVVLIGMTTGAQAVEDRKTHQVLEGNSVKPQVTMVSPHNETVALSTPALVADKPNIIVFLVDDMGVMDTSVPFLTDNDGNPKQYPLNEFYRTPGMERLAAQGIRFSQFCAQSVCSPSRASIVTGQNATRHQTTTWIKPSTNNRGQFGPPKWNWEGLKKGDVTLPAVLKQSGYRTIHVGKAHFGAKGLEGADPTNIGFEVNIAGACWGRPKSYLSENHYGNHPKYKVDKKGKPLTVTHNVPHLEKYFDTGTFLTEALTLEAKDQIRKSVKEDKPFFLHLSHYAVHGPFNTDPRFIKNYAGSSKPKKAKAFATLVEGMDKSLNDIMDELETLHIAENTLIIFLGDNGTDAPLGKNHDIGCAAPLRGKKATHYEGGMRVPFIAAWAKPDTANKWQMKLPIAQNAIQTQMGTIMDIYPTLLDLVNADNPSGHAVDGSSLKTLFTGERDSSRHEMFLMHYPHQHRSQYFTSYRLNNWKVIYHYNPKDPSKPRYELFDLKNDPFENSNQANSHPERLGVLLSSMVAQMDKEGAQYPVGKNGKELRPLIP
jgi:arylsulfatase A-like enzyme